MSTPTICIHGYDRCGMPIVHPRDYDAACRAMGVPRDPHYLQQREAQKKRIDEYRSQMIAAGRDPNDFSNAYVQKG